MTETAILATEAPDPGTGIIGYYGIKSGGGD